MDNFIKKIFDKKIDDWVHVQFQKFSRGEFNDKALVRAKFSAGKYSIDTTAEYARELVKMFAEKLGDKSTHVTGALVSALELSDFKYESKSSAMGVRKYNIDRDMTGKELVNLCDSINKAFFGLSFKVGDEELKIRAKSPKSAKGASSAKKEDADLKIDFCKIKTTDKNVLLNLLFDNDIPGTWKKIEVRHNFLINEIVIPPELKGEKDFAVVREKSLRKGKIQRSLNIDGNVIKKECEFSA